MFSGKSDLTKDRALWGRLRRQIANLSADAGPRCRMKSSMRVSVAAPCITRSIYFNVIYKP